MKRSGARAAGADGSDDASLCRAVLNLISLLGFRVRVRVRVRAKTVGTVGTVSSVGMGTARDTCTQETGTASAPGWQAATNLTPA
jgi:hypothetical protein